MKQPAARSIRRIMVPYVLFAGLWILLTDPLLVWLQLSPATHIQWSICKGLLYVFVTAVLLGALLHSEAKARQRDEVAIAENEARYRSLFENIRAMMVIINPENGSIVDANPAACRFYGWSRDELQRKTISQINVLTPQELQPALSCAKTAQNFPFFFQHRLDDGSLRDVEVFSGPIAVGGQQMLYFIIYDITERQRIQARLAEAERLQALLLESIQEGVLGLDATGLILFENASALSMFQRPAGEMTGQHAHSLFHHHHADGCPYPVEDCPIHRTLQDGKTRRVENEEFHRKDDSSFPVEYTCNAVRDDKGTITGAVVSFRDITARNHADQIQQLALSETEAARVSLLSVVEDLKKTGTALRESELRHRLLAEVISAYAYAYAVKPDGTLAFEWSTDSEGRVAGHSSAELRALGGFRKTIYPDDRPHHAAFLSRAIAGQADALEFRVLDRSGAIRWLRSYITPVWDDAHCRIVRLLGASHNITERRALEEKRAVMEEQVRRLNIELEQRVRDRTAQLEAANRELEAFSYSVSHDLRAPLRHITGFVDLLRSQSESSPDDKSRSYLQTITDSAVEMGRLIDDLLFFSRVGRGEMRTARIAMDHLVRQAIEMANREATRSDIVWHIARLPEVHADPEMLRLVLANLLSNAIKYTRTRTPPVIEIACENHETETVFSIRDNGVGFDMRYANKLFGVFQRLHRAAEFEGTGIGLASVRRIIARHGGRTWAEGVLGQGATFYFSLPRKTAKDRVSPRTLANNAPSVATMRH